MTDSSFFLTASAVSWNNKAILITGQPGSGKSDLALRLIQYGAKLIGDDRLKIKSSEKLLYAYPHPEIQGLLEVRGLGIIKFDFVQNIPIYLHVSLTQEETERLPESHQRYTEINGVPIFSMCVNPFHISSIDKVFLALELAQNMSRLYK